MKVLFTLVCLLALLLPRPGLAQFGINGAAHPSAALDVKASDKAFYPPRLTTAQRKAMANPQPGAFVYDLDQSTCYLYDGANWLPMAFQNPAAIAPTIRLASDGVAGDYFGHSVTISGGYALVGAYNKAIGTYPLGAAYVFVRSGGSWVQQARLTASPGAPASFFGYGLAINSDYAFVGAYFQMVGSNNRQGAVYVFARNGTTWTQQQILTASDGAASDYFGHRISLSADYALIGAYGNNVGSNPNQGAAYVFVRNGTTWTQQAKLTASDGAANDELGEAVALSGEYALLGTPNRTVNGNASQGAAYVFVRNGTTWTQQQMLTAVDGTFNDWFGTSVSISGNYALVGASNKAINGNGSQGAAYVFVRNGTTWTHQAKLTANDGAGNDRFGISVAISGDYALVGASYKNPGGIPTQGAAYAYKRSGTSWSQLQIITGNSPANTYFGTSVGLSNGSYCIGGYGFQSFQGRIAFGVLEN